MKDLFVGLVTRVIDLETIRVEIRQIVRNKFDHYGTEEIIRFNSLQHRLDTYRKFTKKGFIEALLIGKGVMCLVNRRNSKGYLEADVYALGH
jgi:hypothetical protein